MRTAGCSERSDLFEIAVDVSSLPDGHPGPLLSVCGRNPVCAVAGCCDSPAVTRYKCGRAIRSTKRGVVYGCGDKLASGVPP